MEVMGSASGALDSRQLVPYRKTENTTKCSVPRILFHQPYRRSPLVIFRLCQQH